MYEGDTKRVLVPILHKFISAHAHEVNSIKFPFCTFSRFPELG